MRFSAPITTPNSAWLPGGSRAARSPRARRPAKSTHSRTERPMLRTVSRATSSPTRTTAKPTPATVQVV